MSSRADVGVLTLHRCINHGSYWQARCLVDALRARGLDAVILDHRSSRIDLLEWRCALRPTLPTPVPASDRGPYRAKVRRFIAAIEELPLSHSFDLENNSGLEAFETVVVGSDEVWNLWHPFYTGQTLFFGHGLEHARKLAYAASFGNYDAGVGLTDPWCGWLRDFAAVSVRDENSRLLVENAGIDAPIVLDPCLQFTPHPDGDWRGGDDRFAVVYGHNFSPWFAAEAREWARARDIQLVSVGYRNDWADVQWIDSGPHDFAHAVRRADAMITNFFHGTVFALRHEKPFVAEATPYRSHKVRGLLTAAAAAHHLVDDACGTDAFRACLDAVPDAEVFDSIDMLRDRSERFLQAALALAPA